MRYIKSITQQKLSFLLAIYIGLFMNGAVFYRRFGNYAHDFTVWKVFLLLLNWPPPYW